MLKKAVLRYVWGPDNQNVLEHATKTLTEHVQDSNVKIQIGTQMVNIGGIADIQAV